MKTRKPDQLERLRILSGCEDRLGRPIHGIFEILIHRGRLREQMEKAAKNKGRECWDGPLVVRFQDATKAQADFLVQRANAETQKPSTTEEGSAKI
jgi:hypothetical protein